MLRLASYNCNYINRCAWCVVVRSIWTLLVDQVIWLYLGSFGTNDCRFVGE